MAKRSYNTIKIERQRGITWLILNRPEKRNAMSPELHFEMSGALDDLAEDALYVMRGGSYAEAINNVRTAVRGAVDPGVRNETIGFRLVISGL